jgi:NADH-quinone oxidoreductase subunit E
LNEEEIKQQAAGILKSWRGERKDLTPILQEIQAKFGYLPPEAMLEVAEFLRIPESSVYRVATFYNQFRSEGNFALF